MKLLKKYHPRKMRGIIKHRRELLRLVKNYLFFAKNPDKSAWGSITKDDAKGIARGVELSRAYEGAIVEIGTLFGHTTNLIACLKPKEKELVTVDNFAWNPFCLRPEDQKAFAEKTLQYAMQEGNTRIFHGDAADFYQNGGVKPSMVFIDAEHDYKSLIRDITWAKEVGCPVICGHDYLPLYPGLQRAVKENFGDDIEVFGSVWLHHAKPAAADA